jgi:hemoglobin
VTAPPSPYERLGGEPAVRALVARFQDPIDSLPEARAVRAPHPADLAHARDEFALFLLGWHGGPPFYVEWHGHPRLRARHLWFRVGRVERDQWMLCMRAALVEVVPDAELRAHVDGALDRLATHTINTP